MAAAFFSHQLIDLCLSSKNNDYSHHYHRHHAPATTPLGCCFSPATTTSKPIRARLGAGAETWSQKIPRMAVTLEEERSRGRKSNNNGSSPQAWGVGSRHGRKSVTKMAAVGLAQGESYIPPGVRKVKETKVVTMVDPVEAKRLALLEMKKIEARKKLKRQTEIEAINGGWAVLGLTAGIIIDGYTGKSILIQIAGYLDVVADFLTRIAPS